MAYHINVKQQLRAISLSDQKDQRLRRRVKSSQLSDGWHPDHLGASTEDADGVLSEEQSTGLASSLLQLFVVEDSSDGLSSY